MRRLATVVGIVLLLIAVAIGGVYASLMAWPLGAMATGVVLAAIGWVTRRWWTVAVLPLVVGLWALVTYLSAPGEWHDGNDITTAGWFAVFGVAALAAGVAVGFGVLVRRVHDHTRRGDRAVSA